MLECFLKGAIMNWNLEDIFKTKEEFNDAQKQILKKLKEIGEYKGNLGESADNLYNCYRLYEETLEIYERFYSYGMLNYHLDMANSNNIKLYKTVENIGICIVY